MLGFITNRRFVSEYCIFLGGNLLSWRSEKQNIVARSGVKAEFCVMAQGVFELLWLKIALNDLRVKC